MKRDVHHPSIPATWPPGGLESVARCPVCGSPGRTLLYGELTDRVFFAAPGEWTLYTCDRCGSAYLDPRPTPDTIGRAYQTYYTHSVHPIEEWRDLGWYRRSKRILANGYRNHRFGTDERPASRLGVLAARVLSESRSVIEAEGRGLPITWDGASVLDVGCGSGTFLDFAKRAGWRGVGVDPDPAAVAVARGRGLDVHLGEVDVLEATGETFDVITLSHVIEHVHDPLELLAKCRRLLKASGWIWIQTPNLSAQGHAGYGRNWRGLEPPRHLVLFNPSSLRYALETAGFRDTRDEAGPIVCEPMFRASRAISMGLDPNRYEAVPLRSRRIVRQAERRAQRHPGVREFITVTARISS